MNAPASRPPLIRYFPAILFLIVILLMTTCFTLSFSSRSGRGVDRDDAPVADLPEDATDINYYIPGLMGKDIYMDFKTTESGYMSWIESHTQTELEKRVSGTYSIERYSFDLRRGQTVEIQDGILYAWTDGDKGVFLGFDRGSQRAYFHSKAE